ncbi:ANTAR domain-containing protein [Nocardioides anomalus]|uniref:ANTAR domain-containing protein n=1 Tax=Nocardioides anomalus TaxID=2712223 RepID=A0A6G6WDE9_9ACTN|nr:ANTAR domain-containing protein [Nocardioides anomalus]QIG43371.1 ANTAR domain-containing protein [Nocardioides anomalus]
MSTRFNRSGPSAAPTRASVDELENEIRHLKSALTGRAVIDQAKGVLMRHFGVDAETAFQVLVRWSSHTNHRVSALALEVNGAASQGADAVAVLVRDVHRRRGEDHQVSGP